MKNFNTWKSLFFILLTVGYYACGAGRDSALDASADSETKDGFDLTTNFTTNINTFIKTGVRPPQVSDSSTATFGFYCKPKPCTFKCQIDSGSWQKCKSPKTYNALTEGAHTFKVKATNNGITDKTPASYTWIVDFSPPVDRWLTISTKNAPSARTGMSAVWTGSEMIIWGGRNGTVNYRDGSRYNPVTDVWKPVSTKGAPSACANHSVIWTGTLMIIWGGDTGYNGNILQVLNTGAIYNPSTDSWSSISTAGAPAGRTNAGAIWTGTEMIVWGGDNGNPYDPGRVLNSGGRYNPATNIWQPTSLTNAPEGRFNPTLVWTGDKMLVWGGSFWGTTGCAVGLYEFGLNNGGIYDPEFDSWTAMATANAPSARYKYSAAWTGTELLIWGGIDKVGGISCDYYLYGDGAKYNLSNNTWTAISSTNAPSARYAQATVWTGSRMIIWGGNNLTQDLYTGAIYDPSGDSWTSITTSGAPTARNGAVAVWSGNSMVIWGGTGTGTILDSGARYFP